ncbi:MAG: type II secretion system protein [Sedimentisphaerales bacterium]|nr:type II secretion system protein [Sedimentisphaerales bacterium]
MRQGFTIIELLVVIAIVAVMMAILVPALSRTREQARITAVNAELRQIGLALGLYFEDHQKFPPTQEDCFSGRLTDHLYQLPTVLSASRYLPSTVDTNPMSTVMEDRYNRGRTYKYRSVGEVIKDRDIVDKWIQAKLWIPDGFPSHSTIDADKGKWYPNGDCPRASSSPVAWVVFSLGPRFNDGWLEEKLGMENRYPVPRELWYSAQGHHGLIVRMQLKNGVEIGSFQ